MIVTVKENMCGHQSQRKHKHFIDLSFSNPFTKVGGSCQQGSAAAEELLYSCSVHGSLAESYSRAGCGRDQLSPLLWIYRCSAVWTLSRPRVP